MGFQDVAFQPSQASYYTTSLKQCGSGESPRTTTCLNTAVGVSKGMLLAKDVTPTKPLPVSVEFHGDHKIVTIPDLRQWCLSV